MDVLTDLLLVEGGEDGFFIMGAILQYHADFFAEERGQRIVPERGYIECYAGASGEGHLGDSGKEPAIGTVVIGQDQIVCEQLLDRIVEAAQVGCADIGHFVTDLVVGLGQAGAA